MLLQVARLAWQMPFARAIAPRRPVTVLYHSVPAVEDGSGLSRTIFEQHILFLERHFDFVALRDAHQKRGARQRTQVLLTFDDGFRNNAEVVAPLLRRLRIPAVFFVASRHAQPGKCLWFSYLRALERHFRWLGFHFRGEFFDMAATARRHSVSRLSKCLLGLSPHPTAMYQAIEEELPPIEDFLSEVEIATEYSGMTGEQVGELAADSLFSIGVHTMDHPFLTRCEPTEARRQIEENRTWLETVSGRRCDSIAYPSGDYSQEVLDLCRSLAFTRGFAVANPIDRRSDLALSRIGIYAKSTDLLAFKVQWGHFMRNVRIPVG